jgi:hypothetical protein
VHVLFIPCFNESPTHVSAAPPCTCALIIYVKFLFHAIRNLISCFLKIMGRQLKYWFAILGVGILVFTTPLDKYFCGLGGWATHWWHISMLSYLCIIGLTRCSFKSPSGGRCSFYLLHVKSVRATSICLHDSTFNDDDSLPSASAPEGDLMGVVWFFGITELFLRPS